MNDATNRPLVDNPKCRLVWEISALGVSVMRYADAVGRRMGVTGSQWLTLKAVGFLAEGRGAPVRDVAALLNVNGSFISGQAKCLHERGLLRRSRSLDDRRVIHLSLTEEGEAQLAHTEAGGRTLEKLLRGDLEDDSMQMLTRSLNAMTKRVGRAVRLADPADRDDLRPRSR
ncbi:MarR family transcriptional regulator [Rhodopseudomonas palustris]|uniref:MarR family transcriptional regulator n=1 Tax=Rhodopseudomonas palustris TaxID=1076 RepID=A0A323UP39_RHOPL|nr:MarR family transcriptional regulator [Rhodopseudomonas palustris]